jgi:hypothetical protein
MKPYAISDDRVKAIIQEQVPLLVEKKFTHKNYITGDEILQFSGNAQLNKFILFQIYQEWNAYTSKISHPYFDFSHPEVKDALKNFQNILSRHIKIDKFDFRLLVEKAYFNKLKLIFNPAEALVNFFYLSRDKVTVQLFEKYANYFSDFDFILSGVLTYYKKNNAEHIDKNGFIEKMLKITVLYENKTGCSIDDYRNQLFKDLVGWDISLLNASSKTDFTFHLPQEKEELCIAPETVQAFHPTNKNLDNYASQLTSSSALRMQSANAYQEEKNNNPITLPQEQATISPELHSYANAVNKVHPNSYPSFPEEIKDQNIASKTTEKTTLTDPVTPKPTFQETAVASSSPINETVSSSSPPKTIAEQFRAPQVKTIHHLVGKDQNIKLEQIPIHKQFQFIQKIFSGNAAKFKEAIEKVNSFSSYQEAEEYLNTRILNKPDVSRTDSVTTEFIQIVKRKFT